MGQASRFKVGGTRHLLGLNLASMKAVSFLEQTIVWVFPMNQFFKLYQDTRQINTNTSTTQSSSQGCKKWEKNQLTSLHKVAKMFPQTNPFKSINTSALSLHNLSLLSIKSKLIVIKIKTKKKNEWKRSLLLMMSFQSTKLFLIKINCRRQKIRGCLLLVINTALNSNLM